jgi:oligoendopeptidase F
MDRRGFIQTTGIGAVAALVGRGAIAVEPAEIATAAPGQRLPNRDEVPVSDTWDLSSLFSSDQAWEETFVAWDKKIGGYAAHAGKLSDGPAALAACLKFDLDLSRGGERLGTYAMLKCAQDESNSTSQRMQGRYIQAASRAGQASSFIQPELLALPQATIEQYLASAELAPYKILLERILRRKPHTLSQKEEKLLAMQAEMAGASQQIFRQLNDADLKFGTVKNDRGETVELSHGSFIALLTSPDRKVRSTAFHKYYDQYEAHAHALAAALAGTVERDVYYARARNFPSAREAALFPDNIPVAVYDNLIASVHKHLPALYHYYEVRRRKMNLPDVHHYDTYVPILTALRQRNTWDQAVDKIMAALAPLGTEYCSVLEGGLRDRWCDRYENRGKQSGAFSSGAYDGHPYILINYQPDSLESVFTLAHEGGHAMHTYFSAKTQPYAYYDYVLFVAEVASTFNEALLARHLLKNAATKQERAFVLNRQIDTIRATIFRQTMFAEFEKLAHASVESGEPLTLDRIKGLYHGLLEQYFGPKFTLDPELDLECLRIPHFYRNFYVYKYATGLAASMALADRVTNGGPAELNDYLTFLKGGCSKYPLDLLRGAGVDMEKPTRVDQALDQFGKMVEELDSLV